MDWKVILTTFVAIFVAEVADKTQMVGIAMASKTLKPISVFLGSVSAYALITALSILIGTILGHHIRPEYLRWGGGALFVVIGVLMVFNKI